MPKKAAEKKVASKTKRSAARSEAVPVTRRLHQPKRIWFKPRTWKYRPLPPEYQPIPKARLIFRKVLLQLWSNRKLFGGIAAVYGLLNILLVRGLSGSSDLTNIKDSLDSVFSGVGGKVASSLTGFAYLLGTSGSGNTETSGVYQVVLIVICSLAFIWALRQTVASNTVRIRDSFYNGMYPLVPFLLLLLIIGVQLVPLAIGGGIYSIVLQGGIAVQFWEKAAWTIVFAGLAFWSLRMITASIVAIYVITLPDMTPIRALRSAQKLVVGRRLLLWRKLLFLPVVLLLLAAAIELPLILFATVLAPWVFFVLSTVALAVVHAYLYNLYREML